MKVQDTFHRVMIPQSLASIATFFAIVILMVYADKEYESLTMWVGIVAIIALTVGQLWSMRLQYRLAVDVTEVFDIFDVDSISARERLCRYASWLHSGVVKNNTNIQNLAYEMRNASNAFLNRRDIFVHLGFIDTSFSFERARAEWDSARTREVL